MNPNLEKMNNYLDNINMRHQTINDNCAIMLGNTEKIKGVQFILYFKDIKDGPLQYAQIQVHKLCEFPEEKKEIIFRLCSELNKTYCGISFYVKEDINAITVNVRATATTELVAEDIYSEIISMVRCIDEAYPLIMKEIWS